MSVWAIAMVKDEIDVIEDVIRHVAAQGVAGIIVADNGSTDGTYEALREMHHALDCDFTVAPDPEVAYYQSSKMSRLAEEAHAAGAEWIWPFDADEVWYYGETQRLADIIEHADGDVTPILMSRLWHHFPTALDANAGKGNPFTRMRYRAADEAPLGKVIVKWRPGGIIHAGNHGATLPNVPPGAGTCHTDIQVRHFPYRSPEQFVSKAINGSRAYAETDLDWSVGQHWREYGVHYAEGGEARLREIYREHFYYSLPSASGLVYDPARLDS